MNTKKELVIDFLNPADEPMVRFYNMAFSIAKTLPENFSFIEIGTRSGHASILLLKAINDSGKKNRWLFTVDPYGNKPYGHGKNISTTFDYGEQHYRNALYSLSKYAFDNDLLHYHYRMRSQEFHFMKENTEFWFSGEKMSSEYGFVYLDGEHTQDAVNKELDFFLPRLAKNGGIVVDDMNYLNKDELRIKGYIQYEKLFYLNE